MVGLEVSHDDPVSPGEIPGMDSGHLEAVRMLYARAGGPEADQATLRSLSEISGLPASYFSDDSLGGQEDLTPYPEENPFEEPNVPLARPYVYAAPVINNEAERLQVEASAYAPDPPKIPVEPPTQAAGIRVLASETAAERIAELQELRALHSRQVEPDNDGIDIVKRFNDAVNEELLDLSRAGYDMEGIRTETTVFRALASYIARRVHDPEGDFHVEVNPDTTPSEGRITLRGVWRAVTGKLKRMVATSRQ